MRGDERKNSISQESTLILNHFYIRAETFIIVSTNSLKKNQVANYMFKNKDASCFDLIYSLLSETLKLFLKINLNSFCAKTTKFSISDMNIILETTL